MTSDLRETLETLTEDELRTHARALNVDRLSSLTTKVLLVDAILERDSSAIRKRLKLTWFDNHRLGIVLGIIGIGLTLAFGLTTLPTWSTKQDVVQTISEYGWINISTDRRNAIQNAEFDRWLSKTGKYKTSYASDDKPTTDEYNSFIAEFLEFAEHNFTQAQIKWFNLAFGSGCGIERTENAEQLDKTSQEQMSQLGLIEWYLKDFIEYNRKNEEPKGYSAV